MHLELAEVTANHPLTARLLISTPKLFLAIKNVTGDVFWLSDHELPPADIAKSYFEMITSQETLALFALGIINRS